MSKTFIFPDYKISTLENSVGKREVVIESYVRIKALDGRYFLVKLRHKEDVTSQHHVAFFVIKKYVTRALELINNYKITTEMINQCEDDPFDLSMFLDTNQEEELIRLNNVANKRY